MAFRKCLFLSDRERKQKDIKNRQMVCEITQKRGSMGQINLRKAAMIGCGFVGSSAVFSLMQSGLFAEMVLIDADRQRAEGEAMDISHGIPLAQPMKIYAGDYDDITDAAIIIVTAGAAQKPNETRLDLVKKNVGIFQSIIPEIARKQCMGTLLIVSNPVDVLTYTAIKLSGFEEHRVIGSGTVLDTARLKYDLGQHLGVDARSVHAYIMGEHGDSEIAAWSNANVSGVPLDQFCEMRGHFEHDAARALIADEVKNSAYEIIQKKKATYYGIAMSVKRICEAILRDEKSIMPISTMLHGEYGIKDVVLSMPAIVGKNGRESLVPLSLDDTEIAALTKSANTLKEIIKQLDL
jgi:L-lactate dehydrogenase